MHKTNNFVFYLRSISGLDENVLRRIYWWDKALYVDDYSLEGRDYIVKLYDIDGNGKSFHHTCKIPCIKVLSIEELD